MKQLITLILHLFIININLKTSIPFSAKPIPKNAIPTKFNYKVASSIAKSERRQKERSTSYTPRPQCTNCKRPTSICLCDTLPKHPIQTKHKVLVLQHPTEFRTKKTISTVPLLPLVLEYCKVVVGYEFDEGILDLEWVKEVVERGEKPLLLFPGPDSVDLRDFLDTEDNNNNQKIDRGLENDEHSETKKQSSKLLILLDGTWTQAKRMARVSPALLSLCQKVQFSTTQQQSIYNAIRKEPKEHYLSTLECVVLALEQLEPDSKDVSKHLTHALQELVNQQLVARDRPDAEARFVLKNHTKFIEKHRERRLEIEQSLFQTQTPYSLIHHPNNATILKDGNILRPLYLSDTSLINACFERRSSKSFTKIQRQITLHPTTCLGIFQPNNNICGYILQYENGILGMLYIKEEFRRRGYGTLLVQKATDVLEGEGKECVALILDGNSVSERVFERVGWVKADPMGKRGTGRRRAPRMWIKPKG